MTIAKNAQIAQLRHALVEMEKVYEDFIGKLKDHNEFLASVIIEQSKAHDKVHDRIYRTMFTPSQN